MCTLFSCVSCGYLNRCEDCYNKNRPQAEGKCPECRKKIDFPTKTYT